MGTNLTPQGANGGTFDVVAYRADPTGSADSSTAVQAAMTAAQTYAASNGRATVKFPPGKYKLNSTVKLIGGNATIDAYGAYIFAGSNNDLFRDWTSQDSSYTLNGNGLTILGGTWDLKGQNWGTGATTTLNATGFSGFTLSNSSNITFRDVTVRNVYDYHAIDMNSCRNVIIENCRFEGFKNNFTWLQDVVTATTANITLSGTQTIDTIAVVADQRVLVKNQTTAKDNGIYLCKAGAWVRATDIDASAEFNDVAVENATVSGGTNTNKAFYQSAYNPTVGTTSIVWTDTSSNAFHNESRKYSEAIQIDCGPNNVATINVTVKGCFMGPAVDGSGLGGFGKLVGSHTPPSTHYLGIKVVGNHIDSPLHAGVGAYEWDNSLIADNVITSAANQACILVDTCVNLAVTGNVISTSGVIGGFEGGTKNGGTGTTAQNNAHCVKVTGSGSADISISNNNCVGNDSSGCGIQLQGGARYKVSGNTVHTCGQVGIYVSSGSADACIVGNAVIGAGRTGSQKGAISVSGNGGNTGCFIDGNMIRAIGSGSDAIGAIGIEATGTPRVVIGTNDLDTDFWGTGFGPYNLNSNVLFVMRDPITFAVTTATSVGTSATTITDLTAAAVPLGNWEIDGYIDITNTGATAMQLKLGDGTGDPTTTDLSYYMVGVSGTTTRTDGKASFNSLTTSGVATAFSISGHMVVSAAGSLEVSATRTGGSAGSARPGSYIKYTCTNV